MQNIPLSSLTRFHFSQSVIDLTKERQNSALLSHDEKDLINFFLFHFHLNSHQNICNFALKQRWFVTL